MIRKILHPLMAVVLAAGLASASVHEAQARRGAGVAAGVAAGIIGLGILGAAASARGRGYHHERYDDYDEPACYHGPRRCGWENRRCFEDRYGDMVCRGGDWICRRPLICD